MKNILNVFKKEMRRFFTDRRMILALFGPGILIFCIYTLMGSLIPSLESDFSKPETGITYNVAYTDNYITDTIPDTLPKIVLDFDTVAKSEENSINTIPMKKNRVDEYKEKVKNNEVDVLVVFSDNFDKDYIDPSKKTTNAISLFYSAGSKTSTHVYSVFSQLLSTTYQNYSVNFIDGVYVDSNVSQDNAIMSSIMAFIFPIITISMLFSTAASICPESIAGEKERGTLSSVLLTPIKRYQLAFGKILALTFTGICSGVATFIGLFFSLPKLMGGSSIFNGGSALTVILMFLLIITLLLVFISFGTLISAYCKSVKEASSYLSPMMILFLMFAVIPLIVDVSNTGFAFVPILNSVSLMSMLIKGVAFTVLVPYFLITIAVNVVIIALLIYVISLAFKSEKVMMR